MHQPLLLGEKIEVTDERANARMLFGQIAGSFFSKARAAAFFGSSFKQR